MNIQDQLDSLFPNHRSSEREQEWQHVVAALEYGQRVSGEVVMREQFGVFLDVGLGFPALILVVRFTNADRRRYVWPEDYPAIGSQQAGQIYAVADSSRQIGMTQLALEDWSREQWLLRNTSK